MSALHPRPLRRATRPLRIWQFLVLAVVYVVIVQGASMVLNIGSDAAYAEPTTVGYLVRSYVIPVGLAIVFVLAVTTFLGAWQQVFTERRRFRPWVLVIPGLVFLTTVVVTNYVGLGEKGLEFALLLLVATLMVGFGEELLFRGLGVFAFRGSGASEVQVGLWTTVIFGVAHGSNIFTAGPSALLQIVLTTATGFVFYLILRSTGALMIAAAAHGLWDFSVLSTQVNPDAPSPMSNVAGAVLALILLIALIFRRRLAVPPASGSDDSRTDAEDKEK